MKRFVCFVFFILSFNIFANSYYTTREIKKLYSSLQLDNQLNYSTFEKAIKGYNSISNKRNEYITIIDFTKPSTEKRFFVIDLLNKKIDYSTYVSHGKNSGGLEAIKFSNLKNSYQSSLGFFLTGNTYSGANGYSLRLTGLEPGINSNALERNIVIHGADYASEQFIEKYGFLGRSLGCPAIPSDIARNVIDEIKNNTVLFIHGNDEYYDFNSDFSKL